MKHVITCVIYFKPKTGFRFYTDPIDINFMIPETSETNKLQVYLSTYTLRRKQIQMSNLLSLKLIRLVNTFIYLLISIFIYIYLYILFIREFDFD